MNRSNFKNIKLYVGAMSKNCVDALLEIENIEGKVGFISSRRQIDLNGGYVNNWTTNKYSKYVKQKNKNIIICRDHGGPDQGSISDSGIESFIDDVKHLDLIHIDPWKKHKELVAGTTETIQLIKKLSSLRKNIFFEVGTEESIRYFSIEDMKYFLGRIKSELTDNEFEKIIYCVIQSGVGLNLLDMKNTGKFSQERLVKMIEICRSYNIMTKEHNSDYLTKKELDMRYSLGLDAANIAPELGQIETLSYLNECEQKLFLEFYEECFKSNRWKKWVSKEFNPDANKNKLIKVCGHYIFSQKFCQNNFLSKDKIVTAAKSNIKNRILGLIDG